MTNAQVANFSRIIEISNPDLPLQYTTFMALRLRQMELLAKTVYGPVLKITQRSAHAQNHVSVQRCRKSFTTIVLDDHDFPLTGSNFGNLTALGQFLWPPYVIGGPLYFCPVVSFYLLLSSSSFFFFLA